MLDLKFILENRKLIEENCRARNMQCDLDSLSVLAANKSRLQSEVESLRADTNRLADDIKYGHLDPKSDEGRVAIAKNKESKEFLKEKEALFEKEDVKLRELLGTIPNITHPHAPKGGEEVNRVISEHGIHPAYDFPLRSHEELVSLLDLADFEGAARTTGAKFYFLKNEAVLLELALVHYALEFLMARGFTPFSTPDLARLDIIEGLGYNPRGNESQIYSIAGSDLGLIATAEITLGGLYKDAILKEDTLPLRLAGLSHCFRTEAGAYGKTSKGLYRVHQFTKVEMFIFSTPEDSETLHQELLQNEIDLFESLGLPFRVIENATGDLGAAAYRKYDLEAYLPKEGIWGEITSTSNCTDYQARRLNIRVKRKDGKNELLHTLNGTAIAVTRIILSLLENFQNSDGSVSIPPALHPYLPFTRIEP
ncbi:MAG: serine--tRNA ligase [Candidatus Harrisonbacteria bacterium]|nr:serine--tRNA ligase [Candidatus Harrisonbacteria bacterium]